MNFDPRFRQVFAEMRACFPEIPPGRWEAFVAGEGRHAAKTLLLMGMAHYLGIHDRLVNISRDSVE